MNTDLTSNDEVGTSDDSSDSLNVFPFHSFPSNGDLSKKYNGYSTTERNSHSLPNPKIFSIKLDNDQQSCHQNSLQGQDCRIFCLMSELESAKKSNKKLKSLVKSLTSELNDLKCTSRHVISNHYPPGVLTAMVSEVYKAQRMRDVSMMARVRQANDERDDALLQLDEVKQRIIANTNKGENWNVLYPTNVQDSDLNDVDFLIYNQASLIKDVAITRKKLENLRISAGKEENGIANESHGKSLIFVDKWTQTPGTLNEETDSPLKILQLRLQEEISGKEEAQASCLKLERLVVVLRKKINGLSLQRENSVESQVGQD